MPSLRPSRIARLPCTAISTMPAKAMSEPTICHGPMASRRKTAASTMVMIGAVEKMMPVLIAVVKASAV